MAATSQKRKVVWRNDQTLQQEVITGSGVLAASLDPQGSAIIQEVRLTLNTASATSENITINLDSAQGSLYDNNFLTTDMNTVKHLRVCDEIRMFNNDKLVIDWANSDSRTWGLEIVYRRHSSTLT